MISYNCIQKGGGSMDIISIIVPVYNVEELLPKCLDSITNQTYENLEIILVDDGSTDSSGKICDEYKLRDKRITVIHRENGGLSAARNSGIDASHGDYILFVDSDDYIDTSMVEFLYSNSTKYNSDMTLCGFKYVYPNGETSDETVDIPPNGIITKDVFWNKFFSTNRIFYVTMWGKLYKRYLWDNLRFPVGKLHEDEFIIHELVENCNTIAIFNETLYYYFQRDNSIVNSPFCVKNLDAYEGVLLRCRFFINHNDFINAQNALTMSMYGIANGYSSLSAITKTEKARIRELKKEWRKLYSKLFWKKIPIATRIKYTVFGINTKLFIKLKRNGQS